MIQGELIRLLNRRIGGIKSDLYKEICLNLAYFDNYDVINWCQCIEILKSVYPCDEIDITSVLGKKAAWCIIQRKILYIKTLLPTDWSHMAKIGQIPRIIDDVIKWRHLEEIYPNFLVRLLWAIYYLCDDNKSIWWTSVKNSTGDRFRHPTPKLLRKLSIFGPK